MERRFRGSLGLLCDTFILAIVGGSKPTTLSASLSVTPLGELASFPTEPTRRFIFPTKVPSMPTGYLDNIGRQALKKNYALGVTDLLQVRRTDKNHSREGHFPWGYQGGSASAG
ncbi:hypothetical protein [Sinorhizobium chiapasense]|uniref:Uncharacterized protein n=1 Tax=Sinorhizobium chiapasense TaxID=501572 RepID=A0ABZ2BMN3_9HYPH